MKKHLISCLIIFIFFITAPSSMAYTSGSGIETDPYEIETVNDLMELANTPGDYASHFILTADLDLSGYGPYVRALIAPDPNNVSGFQGTAFNGVFDGNGHVIENLSITPDQGNDYSDHKGEE